MYSVDVSAVEADGVRDLGGSVLEGEEVVGQLRGPGHLAGPLQAQHQQVQNQTVVLHDEGGKLQATDYSIAVGVVHVLEEGILILHMQRYVFKYSKEALTQSECISS